MTQTIDADETQAMAEHQSWEYKMREKFTRAIQHADHCRERLERVSDHLFADGEETNSSLDIEHAHDCAVYIVKITDEIFHDLFARHRRKRRGIERLTAK